MEIVWEYEGGCGGSGDWRWLLREVIHNETQQEGAHLTFIWKESRSPVARGAVSSVRLNPIMLALENSFVSFP